MQSAVPEEELPGSSYMHGVTRMLEHLDVVTLLTPFFYPFTDHRKQLKEAEKPDKVLTLSIKPPI